MHIMRWGNGLRLRALDLFEQGYGYKSVAHELGLSEQTVREWLYLWRALGSDLFIHPEKRSNKYSSEVKRAVVKDRQAGVPIVEVMSRYQIPNRSRIKAWCRLYAKYGESVFKDQDDNSLDSELPDKELLDSELLCEQSPDRESLNKKNSGEKSSSDKPA